MYGHGVGGANPPPGGAPNPVPNPVPAPAPNNAAGGINEQPQPLETPSTSRAVDSVALSSRLSDFWPDQPRVWFIRTEAILTPQKLGDEAKFDLIISKLSKDVIAQVTDILINPPTTGKYEFLKNRLLAIYEESHNRQIEKLISELELGDQKPSHLLRRMKELATDKFQDDTLRVLWQNRLPAQVRAVLAVSEGKDLESIAAIADKVAEVTRPTHIAAVDQRPNSTFDSTPILAEIAKINDKLRGLQFSRSRSRSRNFRRNAGSAQSGNRSASRGPSSRNASRQRTRPENWLCFYHYRFREKARKCTEPCAWKKEEN